MENTFVSACFGFILFFRKRSQYNRTIFLYKISDDKDEKKEDFELNQKVKTVSIIVFRKVLLC